MPASSGCGSSSSPKSCSSAACSAATPSTAARTPRRSPTRTSTSIRRSARRTPRSSFSARLTMAWAVRAAQLGQQKLLVLLLTITLACASIVPRREGGRVQPQVGHRRPVGLAGSIRRSTRRSSPALLVLSIPAILATIRTGIGFAVAPLAEGGPVMSGVCGALARRVGAYFVGVGIGKGVPAIQAAILGKPAHGEVAWCGEPWRRVARGRSGTRR